MHKSLIVSGIALAAALLVTLPASAVSLNVGGNGGALGGNGAATGTVNTDLGNTNGTDANVRVNLGNEPANANVDLFGTGNEPTTGNVTVGNGSGGTHGDVLVNLFGAGADTNGQVAIGTGTPGGDNDVTIGLFGPGGAGGNGGNGGVGNGGAGGNGGGAGMPGARTGQIAAAGKVPATQCFAPNAEQQAKLVARHDYSQTTASWGEMGQLKVIDVGLCSSAAASIAGQGNISALQAYIAAHAEIRAGLNKLGHSPSEVIAGDKTDTTLTLYVM